MREWSRMPSSWIRDKDLPLEKLKWNGDRKADQIAALMVYIVLVHHANTAETPRLPVKGTCDLTYTQISDITSLSRSKISGGLKILIGMGLIEQIHVGRNNIYQVSNFNNKSGWAKLPCKGLYSKNSQRIRAFEYFKLRAKNELNALKIYLLIVSFRNTATNYAQVSYRKISEYTGTQQNDIRPALSLLVNLTLIHIDTGNSEINQYSTINLYRPCHLEAYKHRGTTPYGALV